MCRELLERRPREIQIHSLRIEESEQAKLELLPEAGSTELSLSAGDIFGLDHPASERESIQAQLGALKDDALENYLLYRLLLESRPDVVIDCVNTATAIAYRNTFKAARKVSGGSGSRSSRPPRGRRTSEFDVHASPHPPYSDPLSRNDGTPRLGCTQRSGTSGTGGMGLNIPYTHSEEKPSRMLLFQECHCRGSLYAPFPYGPYSRRSHYERDQARGRDRLEKDRSWGHFSQRGADSPGPCYPSSHRGDLLDLRPYGCRGTPGGGARNCVSSTLVRTGSSASKSSHCSPPPNRWSSSHPKRSPATSCLKSRAATRDTTSSTLWIMRY